MKPKISIITATHRRPDLLYKCMKAVQLSTFQEYEHIIVGDHCDWAERVCELFSNDERIKYFETPSPHVWNASSTGKNVGIEKATTDYIAYCDDDNIILPNHLQIIYDELSIGTQICQTQMCEITLSYGDGSIREVCKRTIKDISLEGGAIHSNDMQCVGHTKKAIDAVDGWTSAHIIAKDNTWKKAAFNVDGYLFRDWKRKFGQNFAKKIGIVTFVYYGRRANAHLDKEYDNQLDKDKLFVYPEFIKENFER